MKDSSTYFEIKSSGEIFPKQTNIGRTPYNHQKEAMANLDCINRSSSYSTLIVLPTGGGKTYTASMWLLKNAIDNNKKILWIAHRQMLLDQAADSFMKYAYTEIIPHISSFRSCEEINFKFMRRIICLLSARIVSAEIFKVLTVG